MGNIVQATVGIIDISSWNPELRVEASSNGSINIPGKLIVKGNIYTDHDSPFSFNK